MTELCVRNRQRLQSVDLTLLRKIAGLLLHELLPAPSFEIGVYLVSASEMAGLNETFLNHAGSTDVISFHYPASNQLLRGEIFISVEDAMAQAERFHTSWQCEVARYLVHGLLHLNGYDDLTPPDRRTMKRHENRLLKELAQRFPLSKLAKQKSPTRRASRHRKKPGA